MGATFVIAVAPVTYGVGIIGLDTDGHACADVLARLGVRNGSIESCRNEGRMTAFQRGCVKMQMRDRRMVGRLAVSDCRISTDLLRSMSF
jgi:hypothetical protein